MNLAIQKTLSLVLLIGIGLILRKKLDGREQLGGIKMLILSIALPATIFVALLKIEIEPSLMFLPLLALGFNLLLLLGAYYMLPMLGVDRRTDVFRTYWLLIPSLAPGLSCFPFVAEYLGEEQLALAALADVGNKVFVLIILYLLAMHLFYRLQAPRLTGGSGRYRQLRGLLASLVQEPVNLVIVAAMVLLAMGLNLNALPAFLSDAILRMSALMTPMVLLFIGLAVRFNRRQFRQIFGLLALRAGLAFCLSALLLTVIPGAGLLAVVFPQSAVSFWPFAHMSAVAGMEGESGRRTFNLELALNVLALSLPLSTVIILTVCSVPAVFLQPWLLWLCGIVLVSGVILPALRRRLREEKKSALEELPLGAVVEQKV